MVMVMSCVGMGDAVLRERLPTLWRRIEDAHYSYLETDDSPEKLQQKKKLEDYIIEYLSLVPHECKFRLAETGKVFQRTVNELSDFSAYRAGLGWAALARYAANLLAQPWRKEYRVIRLYCGYFKHEVEANMVGAEILLHTMGYKSMGSGRLELDGPICPDMVAAVSRDALIAQCECQIMSHIWEAVWSSGARVSWRDVCAERQTRVAAPAHAAARLAAPAHDRPPAKMLYNDNSDIYSNIPTTIPSESYRNRLLDTRYNATPLHCNHIREDIGPENHIPPLSPYMAPQGVMPQVMYPHIHPDIPVTLPHCSTVPVMTPYGIPYYYPVQSPYMIPTPVYAPIKHAATVPVNGYPPMPQYRYDSVPTGQLIELDTPSVYENGKFERYKEDDKSLRKNRLESSRRNSTSKSGLSDVTLPSLPRSDTQPALSKAKEDGMGTYESWDYVFRNLSSKEQDPDRSRFSPSFDRDSRTLDRLDRDERRAKYQPTTLDLEDGMQALNLDRSYDEEVYRTAKVNEIMRMKQEQETKRAKHLAKKAVDERKPKKHLPEPIGNPKADALITPKIAPDKVKLLTKKDVRDRKDIIKQQSTTNGERISSTAEVKKVKKPAKLVAAEVDKSKSKPVENGVHSTGHSSKSNLSSNSHAPNYDLKAQLIVSLDETDSVRRSPPKQSQQNGDRDRPISRTPSHHTSERERQDPPIVEVKRDRWECGTCTYLNRNNLAACEMCGKSKRGPEIQPLRSGGRECPACTLVNERDATICDACGTSLDHCPTYI